MQEITEKIIETYLSRLGELSSPKARHFLWRAYKATGREDILDLLQLRAVPYTERRSAVVDEYLHHYNELIVGHLLGGPHTTDSKPNDAKKNEVIRAHEDVCRYGSFLWSFYYQKALGIIEEIEVEVPEMKKIQEEIFKSPDLLRYAVVLVANVIYLSKGFGIFDREDDYVKFFQEIYADLDTSNIVDFTNYAYGLTHIVIGSSLFYTKDVDVEKYQWVIEAFDKYSDEIFEKLSLDINTEVAYCYKLMGVKNNDYIEKVIKRLEANFNTKDGYIHREGKNSFNFAEHTNAVALLLFKS